MGGATTRYVEVQGSTTRYAEVRGSTTKYAEVRGSSMIEATGRVVVMSPY